jgi:hypothetical protein
VRLKRRILPCKSLGVLEVGLAVSLRSVTLGLVAHGRVNGILSGPWPNEVRCLSSGFCRLRWGGVVSQARVFGEVVAMGERLSSPGLPCQARVSAVSQLAMGCCQAQAQVAWYMGTCPHLRG